MPDSWEFALSQARGDYITFLTDDSYLFPNALERAMAEMERLNARIVVWNHATYFASDWVEPERRNLLYVSQQTSITKVLSSKECIGSLYGLTTHVPAPKLLNSLVHRGVIEDAIRVQGRLFLPPCPDYSAAIGLLQQVQAFAFIDSPLFINGLFPQSIGASQRFNAGKASRDFLAEFSNMESVINLVELKVPSIAVLVAQSLEVMKRVYPNLNLQINQEALVCDTINDLMVHESQGTDVRDAWRILENHLSGQPDSIRKMASRQRTYSKLRLLVKRIRRLPFWEHLERVRGIHVFRGKDWGFASIGECGAIAPSLVEHVQRRSGK
jgi:hypothetical protein